MNKKEIHIDIKTEIITEYKKGVRGMASIGGDYGLSREVVCRILKENGVELTTPGKKYLGGREASVKRYETNPTNRKKRSNNYKQWRIKNLEKLKEYHEQWRKDNDEYKQSRADYERERKRKDPIHRLNCNIRAAVWANLKERGLIKYKRTMETLGYTLEELMQHLERQFTPGMTWENYGEWHVDHIIPLHTAKDNREDVMRLWRLENLQPLWEVTKEIDGVIYPGNLNKGKRY